MRSEVDQEAERVSLLRLVVSASDLVRRQTELTLRGTELTEPMITMLWVLQPSTDMSMRELAAKLNYDPSNVSLLADRLVTMGLVQRLPHPTDGRRRVLRLTERGDALYHEILAQLFERSPIFKLSPEEQQQLRDLLTKIRSFESAADDHIRRVLDS
ncbi:MarR family winged helix-turn-helix transcriptional regulator [Streptomyces fuscichromogenes]|uniref:MarR family winged helix-turn-helix transcriptional regulator n=1 Tax=Streptomyces fuscichromogenes TaxID=1324013 RepID=UPI00166F6504|nr:MarR family transcriptional regulator [Streptomyces fuscichromogenes]